MASKKKRGPGRPPVVPDNLSKRFMIRCDPTDLEAWEARARELGYGGAAAWIRHVANQAIKQPTHRAG